MTPYECELFRTVDDVDAEAWRAVTSADENVFLDLRFLRTVEQSFAREAEFWYAIYRDEAGTAVACTCFTAYTVDGALLAPPHVKRVTYGVRRVWPGFLQYRILLCGTPVSTCEDVLAIAEHADHERVASALNSTAEQLARNSGCRLISFKEFSPASALRVASLKDHDYLCGQSVLAYQLTGEFGSFDQYYSSRSKRTRAKIRNYFRTFESAGLTCEYLQGRDGVDQLFTSDVHRLYLNVLDRAAAKFETIPVEFFQELARNFAEDAWFTIIRKGDRIVGFCCGIASERAHNMLFCGLDYSINAEADLYFNIILRGLSRALVPGVRAVHIGAAADEFKQHMGCTGEPRSVYVKAVGAVHQAIFRLVFPLLFPAAPAVATLPVPSAQPATASLAASTEKRAA